MKGRTEPSQRQRKPDDADLTAVTGSMAPSTAPFVAKSPPPPAPPLTNTGTTGSHGSLTNSLHGTSSLLTTTSNRHKHLDTEVTSAVSSMASSAKTPPRSNPDAGAGEASSPARDETMYLFFGSVQGIIGIVMAVFGVMALIRDASMASTGAGVWGGAVGVVSGTIGMVAGLRSCYARDIERKSIAPTAFMASSLVSIATANLVLVLTSIGLARDFRNLRPEQVIEDEGDSEAWRGVVALCGLVLASALQLLASIASAYRCYRVVCPCASRRHEPLYNQSCAGSPDSLRSTLKSNTKERLVSHWLTGASDAPSATLPPTAPMFPGSPTPSGLLLFSTQPPPPGHHPQTVYSLPPLPPPQAIPLPMRYPPQYPVMIQARPRPRVMRSAAPPSRLSPVPSSHRRRHHQGHGSHDRRRQRRERDQRHKSNSGRTSPVTAAQVAKTYTGLDRKMAEDFLTVMDHGRHNTGSRPASSSSSKPQERVPVKAASTPSPGSATPDDF